MNTKPKGLCDMCNKKKAKYWFGQTSVALCGDEDCAQKNRSNWNRMIEEIEQEEKDRENW